MPPSRENDSQPPSKRRKVGESCKVCRTKKTRCDGQRPACSPCKAKGVSCEYSDVVVAVPAVTLSDIEARVRKLEEQSTATRPQGLLPHPSRASLSQEGPLDPSTADPDHAVALQINSTTRFMQEITQMADTQRAANPQVSRWSKPDAWPVETDTSSMVIPPRAMADDLLYCYERYHYPLFPILHMPSFRASYERMWVSQEHGRFGTQASEASFYATVNIVFALGCLNSSNYEPRLKLPTASTFYRRARALLPLDALDFPSLEVVQCLLLVTSYLSFTKYTNRCCNTLMVAVRVAQTLGLHVDLDSSSSSQLRREMSRRVWHHCLTMERLISTLFGRSTRPVPGNTVPLPEAIDDEYLDGEGTGAQPAGLPSVLDAFIVTANIFEVVEGARKINYGSFSYGLRLPELTEVLQLNERVDQIEAVLPSHLRWDNGEEPETPRDLVLKLQAETVLTRVLHVRLVLLRPTVLAAARQSLLSSSPDPAPSRTETALRTEASVICVEAALSVISMLHANLRSVSRIFSSTAVFVTLSAATVLVAASLVPGLDVRIDDGGGPYAAAIAKAFTVLDEHRWQVEGAPDARDQLEKFVETVNRAKARRESGRNHPENSDGASQAEYAPLPLGIEYGMDGFDFGDPLWDFQWGGSFPQSNMPGLLL